MNQASISFPKLAAQFVSGHLRTPELCLEAVKQVDGSAGCEAAQTLLATFVPWEIQEKIGYIVWPQLAEASAMTPPSQS